MHYEKVHAVWHFHDQVRSGIADFRGAPHHFEAPFDHDLDDYADYFLLCPVGRKILVQALYQAAAFQEWGRDFDLGRVPADSHPMLGENNPAYRERHEWLEDQVRSLLPLPGKYEGSFREAPGQEALPLGVTRELEVCWSARAV